MNRLLDLAEDGREIPDAIWQRIGQRRQEISELKDKIARLESRIEHLSSGEIEPEEVVRFVTFLEHHLEQYILKSFINRIEVDKHRVRIEYTIPRPTGRRLDLEELEAVPTLGAPGTPGRI